MKNICIYLFLLTVIVSPVSWGADFTKGWVAYKTGDYATSLEEWTPLADQGTALAQYFIGVMHLEGLGVPQDYKKAAKWHALAAEQGVAEAQFYLGDMYRKGDGVPELSDGCEVVHACRRTRERLRATESWSYVCRWTRCSKGLRDCSEVVHNFGRARNS